jgi:predicted  nucleic acid-binding Zn-ribbon protein
MQDIAYLNDQLFLENKKLKAQAEVDDQLIKDLGKRLMKANKKIAKLEAELNELRGMQSESNSSSGSSTGEISGTLYGAHVRSPLRRACIGD